MLFQVSPLSLSDYTLFLIVCIQHFWREGLQLRCTKRLVITLNSKETELQRRAN